MEKRLSVYTKASNDSNNTGTSAANNRAIQSNLYIIQESNLQGILLYLNTISFDSEMHSKMHSETHSEMHSEMLSKLLYSL